MTVAIVPAAAWVDDFSLVHFSPVGAPLRADRARFSARSMEAASARAHGEGRAHLHGQYGGVGDAQSCAAGPLQLPAEAAVNGITHVVLRSSMPRSGES